MTAIVLGVLAGLLAGTIWGLAPGIISKYGRGKPFYIINYARSMYAVLLLALIVIASSLPLSISPVGLLVIAISAVFGPLLGDLFYIYSIQRIGGGNAVSIGYIYIFIAQVLSAIFYHEQLSPRLVVGTVLAMTGIYLIYSGEKHRLNKAGVAAALAAALSWGMGATLSRLAVSYGAPLVVALYRNLTVLLILVTVSYRETPYVFTKNGFILGFIAGGLGFGIGMTLFLYAVKTVGVAVTALATSISPVLGRIFSRIIAGEKPSPRAVYGTLVSALGIFIGVY